MKLPGVEAEELVFVQGGFLEVQPQQVTVLADTAIRAKDLDEVKALEAKKAAEEAMQNKTSEEEIAAAEAELASALAQLEAIRKIATGRDPRAGAVNDKRAARRPFSSCLAARPLRYHAASQQSRRSDRTPATGIEA